MKLLICRSASKFRRLARARIYFLVGDPALDHHNDGHLCPYAVEGVICVNPGESGRALSAVFSCPHSCSDAPPTAERARTTRCRRRMEKAGAKGQEAPAGTPNTGVAPGISIPGAVVTCSINSSRPSGGVSGDSRRR